MPPKGKKSKKKLEEELRRKEEEERLAEEERLRAEEEARIKKAEDDRIKAELRDKNLKAEDACLELERQELAGFLASISDVRKRHVDEQEKADHWDRYLKCSPLPDPSKPSQINDYFNAVNQQSWKELDKAMKAIQSAIKVMEDCTSARVDAQQNGDMEKYGTCAAYTRNIHLLISKILDHLAINLLQFCEEFSSSDHEAQICRRTPVFMFGMWFNLTKNSRLRRIDMEEISCTLGITKQISVSSVALMLHAHKYDEYFFDSTNEFMAVGNVVHVDLIALLPNPHKLKKWTVQPVVPRDQALRKLSYPIPPAGADPSNYRTDEEPAPFTFTFPYGEDIVIGEKVQVGWWDANSKKWQTDGISDTVCDKMNGTFTFKTTHLAPIAIIQSRTQLFPYLDWNIRPTGGVCGETGIVTLQVATGDLLLFEVMPGLVRLLPESELGCTSCKVALSPRQLLHSLTSCGINLTPEDRDMQHIKGNSQKSAACEQGMCNDVGLMSHGFLISRSKWNSVVSGEDCLCRACEVIDWEAGGRTEAKHLKRIFQKEKRDGDGCVFTILRKGNKGVAFSPARDSDGSLICPPDYDTEEYERSAFGKAHVNVVSLLSREVCENEPEPRLRSTASGIDHIKSSNPVFTQTMAHFLFALRLFSAG